MKVKCLERRFQYKDKLGRTQVSEPGTVIDLPTGTDQDRALIRDLITIGRAVPADHPEQLKVETLIPYSVRVEEDFVDGGQKGDVRTLPAPIVWPLVAKGYCRPTDKRHWWPGRGAETEENSKIIKLYDGGDTDKKKAAAGRLTGQGGS